MSVIMIRVDDQTREKMNKLSHVNWSRVLRDAIDKKLAEESSRNLAMAVLLNDKVKKRAPPGWDSVETIRYWREHRPKKMNYKDG
jgi:hypothetical protein